jgi:arylsulfatase A
MNSRKEKDKPFFLNLWFHEPHYPLAAPPELVKEYGNPDAEAAIYSATIANTDLAIGRLVAKLAQDGTLDNTLVIYASDNGSYRADRVGNLRAQKGSNFEGGIRVPGFFCWPGTIPGDTSVEQPAGLVDILPTLCGLLGIACPEGVHLDGTSLVPLLTGKAEDFKRAQPLFWHLQKSRPIVAMRDGNYSLVADPAYKLSERNMFNEQWIPLIRKGGYTNFRLYDLSKDPGQQHDLAKAYPEVLARLKKKLLKINASIMQDGTDWSKKRPLAGLGD